MDRSICGWTKAGDVDVMKWSRIVRKVGGMYYINEGSETLTNSHIEYYLANGLSHVLIPSVGSTYKQFCNYKDNSI